MRSDDAPSESGATTLIVRRFLHNNLRINKYLLSILYHMGHTSSHSTTSTTTHRLHSVFLHSTTSNSGKSKRNPASNLRHLVTRVINIILQTNQRRHTSTRMVHTILFNRSNLLRNLNKSTRGLIQTRGHTSILHLRVTLTSVRTIYIRLTNSLSVIVRGRQRATLTTRHLRLLHFLRRLPLLRHLFTRLSRHRATIGTFTRGISGPTPIRPITIHSNVRRRVVFVTIRA